MTYQEHIDAPRGISRRLGRRIADDVIEPMLQEFECHLLRKALVYIGQCPPDFHSYPHAVAYLQTLPVSTLRSLHEEVLDYELGKGGRRFGSLGIRVEEYTKEEKVGDVLHPSYFVDMKKYDPFWRMHFIPYGYSDRYHQFMEKTLFLGCVDFFYFLRGERENFQKDRVPKIIAGATNPTMAHFAQRRLGFHYLGGWIGDRKTTMRTLCEDLRLAPYGGMRNPRRIDPKDLEKTVDRLAFEKEALPNGKEVIINIFVKTKDLFDIKLEDMLLGHIIFLGNRLARREVDCQRPESFLRYDLSALERRIRIEAILESNKV
ncbi:hypothetical protein A2Z00_01460 [Candidatus Gottesmanbacteria bacterium RBG_13_45_10]|uniref:Uncharacterized protein n=1 Tax=Candidatus Gottesmanbacteria bacterium RBG_13_45_10 TaxID=1798370 RepID=A0A1F5ZI84_9BACT|nr:MAG: hypothetical protein A2Z00_01460 [Candidatus Gottesmanbacteria bacterium RBG_13_45_10]